MIKLLLVDDEEYSREGIVSLLKDSQLPLDEIRCAENGEEGLEVAKEFCPDIVLADVRMPRMDGLTMCAGIRECFLDCVFIMISGYSDKEYLKTAIRLTAVNYIEKPFQPEELIDSVKQALERKSRFISEENTIRQQRAAAEEHLTLRLLRRVQGREALLNEIRTAFPDCDTNGPWVSIVMSVFSQNNDGPTPTTEDLEDAAQELCRQMGLSHGISVFSARKEASVMIMHIRVKEKPAENPKFVLAVNEMNRLYESRIRFSIGVGTAVDQMADLYRSYESAMISLQQGFFRGANRAVVPSDEQEREFEFSQELLNQFALLLRKGDAEKCSEFIHDIFQKVKECEYTMVSTVRDFSGQVARRLYYYADSVVSPQFAEEERLADAINRIWKFPYLDDIVKYLDRRIRELFASISGAESGESENLLAVKIRKYVDTYYGNPDLCLQNIADYFNVTTSYLCIAFKKHYQKTINQYINSRRIEQSVVYLENHGYRVKEIAQKVGFQDVNYFIKVFKKTVGVTPKEYRRK